MALKAGRVGVDPSQVTKGGKIIGGGGEPYVLPVATPLILGGVKPVAKTAAMTKEVGVDSEGKLYVEPSQGGGDGQVLFSSITVGDKLSGWYPSRQATRVLASGPVLIAAAFKHNDNYSCGVFYTLKDYGEVANVVTGDYVDKMTLENVNIPDYGTANVYIYGGLQGAGVNGACTLTLAQYSNISVFLGGPAGSGDTYRYGPTDETDYGNFFNAMSADLKEEFWKSLLLTLND